MSKQKLIHIIRPRPSWATGYPVTICGNRSFDGDMTRSQLKNYIKTECRGSQHVAYSTCCVTCLNNSSDHARWQKVAESVEVMRDYFARAIPSKKTPEHAIRVQAEAEAIAELIETHPYQFSDMVERRVLRGGKPKMSVVKSAGGKS